MDIRSTTVLALLAMSLGSPAVAAESTGCDQIEWPEKVLEMYPGADEACQKVITRKGVRYVQFAATFVRADADGNVIVKVRLADGTSTEQEFQAPDYLNVQSESGRSDYDFRELKKGDVLDVFIPETSWAGKGQKAAAVAPD